MEVGLISEGITEIIAVSGENAAPIGIIQRPGQKPYLILFKGSETERNVRSCGLLTANFVSDAYLYPYYAFNDAGIDDFELDGRFQYLKSADAYIKYTANVVHETEQTYRIELNQIGRDVILHPGIRRVNRGFDAVIDAAVHATRYVKYPTPELAEKILYDLDLIRKCGSEREFAAGILIRTVCKL